MSKTQVHSFHIPVMGIGYTIDTPLKVSQYGISSVISLVDDILIEKMRELYCRKLEIPFKAISNKTNDFRAKRITAYLNLIDKIATENFEQLKNSLAEKGSEIEKYMNLLPDFSILKRRLRQMITNARNSEEIKHWISNNLSIGSIDVNIMTKLNRENYRNNKKLPLEFNDAHAALRGFANSTLKSAIILSAGMNPRLYSYFEQFEDFYPDEFGQLRKKIILKVSDFRSALIQGKFLAKKGLWVSEYRIESGLNCGGHAFATDGFLMGPILEDFKRNRDHLIKTTYEALVEALKRKSINAPKESLPVQFSAQGGVGTAEEHDFLLEHYQLDSIGWGTPFLLVPEVTNVDRQTQKLLEKATEEDLVLSNTSPLGVFFNTVKGNTKDLEKTDRIRQGRPGSPCPKKFASNNREFTEKEICLASRQYQNLKIKALDNLQLSPGEYKKNFDKITEKSCICVGLGTSALLANDLDTKVEGEGVSVCPGPNMAYFSEVVSLKKMTDHIYGRANILKRDDRPHMFMKELGMYINYFRKMVEEANKPMDARTVKRIQHFRDNLNNGIRYYRYLFMNTYIKNHPVAALKSYEKELNNIEID
ncbi:hypothetical protein QQ020_31420 [Fulvivirgaceae bacterium BMA12]|uniref:Uncharacterized protein n=1 Tax=Agaribacillus aureus TaxID=3051825 RepID=A0ABT8LFS9_9BACT|nr:hypothetical protein [Fulvivirgaceae bacterium BMA12]